MYETILIPTDGTPEVESAVTHGLLLARAAEGTVHGLFVVDTRAEPPGLDAEARTELRDRARERGRHAVQAVADRAAASDLDADGEVREGAPAGEILSCATDVGADLVVMATGGGGDTERVVANADVPVLAVPRAADVAHPEAGTAAFDRVVISIDGSDDAERAAEHGLEVAERYGAEVRVVYVVDASTYDLRDVPGSIVGLLEDGGRRALEGVAEAAEGRNLPVTTQVLRGVPHEEIRSYAAGADADLVVAGTHGRTGAANHFLGSTTARLLRETDRPLLVVA